MLVAIYSTNKNICSGCIAISLFGINPSSSTYLSVHFLCPVKIKPRILLLGDFHFLHHLRYSICKKLVPSFLLISCSFGEAQYTHHRNNGLKWQSQFQKNLRNHWIKVSVWYCTSSRRLSALCLLNFPLQACFVCLNKLGFTKQGEHTKYRMWWHESSLDYDTRGAETRHTLETGVQEVDGNLSRRC